jgi:hypothetical protein
MPKTGKICSFTNYYKPILTYCGMSAESQQRQPLLGNGSVNTSTARQQLVTLVTEGTRNNGATLGGTVICAIHANII